jgi:hypothetical protein
MKQTKKYLITGRQHMEMKAMANVTGIPEEYVTEAYGKSFIYGGSAYDYLQITKAWLEAERDGRDYTPIYWHRTDDGVLHLTMWDMNKKTYAGRVLDAWNSTP